MADNNLNKLNRTWLCSVVFLDIVNYSSQSVELQIRWKERFNGYLASAIKNVPEDERVILDTGDGAATCFLGAPEAAMFTALELWHSLLLDEREQQPPFKVRIGINLGPVKLVRDINGAPNAIGDGMNAGQRVMSFAGENQILVSQSYFEVVSRLSDDYKNLFSLKGVETDKHIREHTVYHLSPPGVQHGPVSIEPPEAAVPVAASPRPAAPPPAATAQAASQNPPPAKASGNRALPLVIGAVVLVLIAAAAAWHFAGSTASENESASVSTSTSVGPAPAPVAATPTPAAATPAPVTATPPPSAAPVAKPVIATPPPTPAPAPVAAAPSIPRARPAAVSAPVAAEEPPPAPRRAGDMPFATSPPVLRDVPAADRDTARDLRERYAMDAGRAASAWKNAEIMRRELAAKGMSLNAQTASSLDNLGLFLDEAADAMREHKWDDALSSLQAVESATQKVAKAVGN
jgi:class 3 adenylate cyclase